MKTRLLFLGVLIVALMCSIPASATMYASNQYSGATKFSSVSVAADWGIYWNSTIKGNYTPASFQVNGYFLNQTLYPLVPSPLHTEIDYFADAAKTNKIATVYYTLVKGSHIESYWSSGEITGDILFWNHTFLDSAGMATAPGYHLAYKTVKYDNISDSVYSVGLALAGGDTLANLSAVTNDIGLVLRTQGSGAYTTVYAPRTADRLFMVTVGTPAIPTVENCSVPVQVMDMRSGALIGGSTITADTPDSIWNTTETLTYGSGYIAIPLSEFSNTIEVEATASSYTTEGAIFPPDSLTCDSTIRIYLFPQQIAGVNCTMTFAVYDWNTADNGTMEAIPGALVILSDGQQGIAGYAGTVDLIINSTAIYNYTASATGYMPFKSDTDCNGYTESWTSIYLTRGSVPTATVTTPEGLPAHDTTLEALEFLKQNALFLVMLFFVATIFGAIKMIAKW